jgi:hypothetical protein
VQENRSSPAHPTTPLTISAKIKNGGYYPYIASPGNNHFEVSTEATNEANVMVEKGSEKYLKTTIGMGLFVGHLKFTEVSPEIGNNRIIRIEAKDASANDNP